MRPEATILLPVHDEEGPIAVTLEELSGQGWARQLGERLEVIVVDDGSRDGTRRAALAAGVGLPASFEVLSLPVNLGKGLALRAGVERARGDIVGFVDGDHTFHLDQIPSFLDAVRAGAEVVIGDRRDPETVFDVRTKAIGYIHLRHLVGCQFNRIVRAATAIDVADTQCGLKFFSAEAARVCFSRIVVAGFVFDVEVLLAAIQGGFRLETLPVRLRYKDPRPTLDVVRLAAGIAADLGRVLVLDRRGHYRPSRSLGSGAGRGGA